MNCLEVYMLDYDSAWLVYDALQCYSDNLAETRMKSDDLRQVIGNRIDPPPDRPTKRMTDEERIELWTKQYLINLKEMFENSEPTPQERHANPTPG